MIKPRQNLNSPTENRLRKLLGVMERLRDPDEGCQWDKKQTLDSLTPHTIEEAYEVSDAVNARDMADLKEELGDLLFQIIFYSQIAKEKKYFCFEDVVTSITDKMIRRHPHVFTNHGDTKPSWDPGNWESRKELERSLKAEKKGKIPSALDGVAKTLPAMTRAVKMQKRAARIGFDWPDTSQVIEKLEEEFHELQIEIKKQDKKAIKNEMGDLLFTIVNLARHLEIDPETALRFGNEKFENRFNRLEKYLANRGQILSELQIEDLEKVWKKIKLEELG